MSGFLSRYSSVNHLLRACFDNVLLFFDNSNLSLTICFCSSLLLNVEHKSVRELSLLLCLEAKFLAIKEPMEKPTKCTFSNLSSSIKFNSCSEKSLKLIFFFI